MMMDDSQLLASYGHDPAAGALQELIKRHLDFVYAAALRQTRDPHLAQDVTQAVFLLFSQRASRLKPGTLVKGWLFNTTRYVVANSRRAEARRKSYEREAAAMRCEIVREDRWSDISPHLDDALAGLSEKDRRVLLLRYFEDLPLAALGQTLGISENAAQKRVAHALVRLRHFLVGRGATVASASLGEMLQASITQAAPAHLAKATIDLTVSGAAHSSSAIYLAKGAAKMMTRARAKLLAIQCAIAGATIGTVVVLAAAQLRPMPPDRPATVAMANEPHTSKANDENFNSCCQTLKSIVDDYDRNDAAAAEALFYFPPGMDPKTVENMDRFLDVDVSAYHLANVAVSRFGVHGTTLNIGQLSTSAVLILDVLPRLSPERVQGLGNTLVLTPEKPAGPYVGCWQSPIYFVRDQGTWKLDAKRNFRLTFHAIRRQPIAGETSAQACTAAIHIIVTRFAAIADDINKGNISEAESKKQVNTVFTDVDSQFRDCQFGIDH
jgi:RNA polymerase sigma factor (sigma-70 family)